MNSLRPREIVECIDDSDFEGLSPGAHPLTGRLYRVRSVVCDGKHGHGVWLRDIPDPPHANGWPIGCFRKLELADEAFSQLLEALASPRSGFEREILSILDRTAHLEGTICNYVSGMRSEFAGKTYRAAHGAIPPWVLALHPKRRDGLYELALAGARRLPAGCPRPSWKVREDAAGRLAFAETPPPAPWSQPQQRKDDRKP